MPSRASAGAARQRAGAASRFDPVPETSTDTCPDQRLEIRLDTVDVAAQDPEHEQPWAELGLKADEYARIREILGRRPTSSELAMYP